MKRARWKDWLRDAVDWVVFPDIPKCMACGEEELADERLRLCEKCLEKFRQLELDPPIGEMKGYFYVAAYRYDGIVRDCIRNMKYDGREWYANYFAAEIAAILEAENAQFDEITFVPMTRKKQKARGYNQAESIAKAIGKEMGVSCTPYLERIKQEQSQTRLTAKQREKNIKGSFIPRKADTTGKRVLLVDDVMTTGSTSIECAQILEKMGAEKVLIAVFAKT